MSAQLVSAYESTGDLSSVDMGVDIKFADGWYTYWRMPGDSGIPTSFDWSKSTNVKDVELSWPAPRRYTLSGLHSFGYSEQILFPFTVNLKEPGKDATVDLTINAVVCHEICVPQTLHVARTIKGNGKKLSAENKLLENAKKSLPSKENLPDLGIDTAVLGKDSIVVTAYAAKGFEEGADLVVETPNAVLTTPPEIIPDDADKTRALFKIKAPAGVDLSKELFGKTVPVILIHGGKSIERDFAF